MKLSTARFFLILTLTITVGCIGCGGDQLLTPEDGITSEGAAEEVAAEDETQQPLDDDGITWGNVRSADDTPAIPTVHLVRTQINRLGEVDTFFHVEIDQRLRDDLIVALEICHTDASVENVILVLLARQAISEKFIFDEDVLQVKLLPYEDILKLDPQMTPINSRVGQVDLTKYPIQEKRYRVDPKNGKASK